MNSKKRRYSSFFLFLLCSGCTVGPNYKKPAVPVPPEYRGRTSEPDGSSGRIFGDQKWWDVFQDEASAGSHPDSAEAELRRAHRGSTDP